MGYSKNSKAIEKVKSFLDQMLDTRVDLAWPSTNAHMLGYYLREAMTIAQKQGIEPYNTLKDRFRIRNKGDRVVAELRQVETFIGLQAALSKVVVENVTTLMQVVGAAIDHKASEIYFPDADLTQEEIEKLYLWTEKNGRYIVLTEQGVTLTKTDPGEVAWRPEST